MPAGGSSRRATRAGVPGPRLPAAPGGAGRGVGRGSRRSAGAAACRAGAAGWVLVNLACRPDDVLVVGAGRQGMVARLPFSKVSRYCLADAQCPVLAVPSPALARELSRGRLAWAFRGRALTPEGVLRDRDKPAA
jgi:Universal stress protein family